jgi:elongation factor G
MLEAPGWLSGPVFVPSVERGIQKACTAGILAGCRVVDMEANFRDGQSHSVDSKDIAGRGLLGV